MMAPGFPAAVLAAAAAAAEAQLRIGDTAERALIERQCAVALAACEAFVGNALIVRDFAEVLAPGRGWQPLAIGPALAITDVAALDASGSDAVLPAERYAVDIRADGTGWLRIEQAGDLRRVRVHYSAGLARDWESLPEPIAQGVTLLACHLFLARDAAEVPPVAVTALWRPWRRLRLMPPAYAA